MPRVTGCVILTIADLISYRLQTEHLVSRLSHGEIVLDRTGTSWHAIVFEAVLEKRQFLALVKGELDANRETLCRMHAGSTLGDVFTSTSGDGAKHLDEAIDAIEQEGSGVIVYLPPQGDLQDDLERFLRRSDPKSSPSAAASVLLPQQRGRTAARCANTASARRSCASWGCARFGF